MGFFEVDADVVKVMNLSLWQTFALANLRIELPFNLLGNIQPNATNFLFKITFLYGTAKTIKEPISHLSFEFKWSKLIRNTTI